MITLTIIQLITMVLIVHLCGVAMGSGIEKNLSNFLLLDSGKYGIIYTTIFFVTLILIGISGYQFYLRLIL